MAKIILIRVKSIHSWEALGMGYLASYSYKYGGFAREDYQFYDGFFDSEEEIIEGCKGAEFIGFSVTSFSIDSSRELLRKIKRVNSTAKIIWGGYGVNGWDEEYLVGTYGNEVDFFLQGPGEESWLEVITGKATKRVIKKNIVAEIDILPFPDRELIKIQRHFDKLEKLGEGRKTSMEMQRSVCPFDCVFCAGSSYAAPNKRTRTAENIIEEMELLKTQYHMDKDSMVLMCDAEVFLTKDMERMAEMKIERGIDFKYGMNVVASAIIQKDQRRILEKMVKSGLTEVWMGVESDPSLMPLTGKPITPAQVKEAFKITKEMGLVRKAYFILGFTPEETEETIKARIPFIEEIDPDEVGFTLYIPVPGSRGFNYSKHKSINYAASDEYFNDFISTDTLSNADLHKWQQYLVDYFQDKANYRQKSDHNQTAPKIIENPGRSGY